MILEFFYEYSTLGLSQGLIDLNLVEKPENSLDLTKFSFFP